MNHTLNTVAQMARTAKVDAFNAQRKGQLLASDTSDLKRMLDYQTSYINALEERLVKVESQLELLLEKMS